LKIRDIIGGTYKRRLSRGSRIKRVQQKSLFSEAGDKNTHLDHAEEIIFLRGIAGVQQLVNNFSNLLSMLTGKGGNSSVTTKWDGSPAIFCGIDPSDGQFFVGTKGVFAKNAKLNKTMDDIEANHGDVTRNEETVSKEGLREKLRYALQYLPELGITGVLQGDMLYTRPDLRMVQIDGQQAIAFKPNTITYTMPASSDVGRQILSSQIGIVFHTEYTGDSIATMSANFGFNADSLTPSRNVWFTDATIKNVSNQVSFSDDEVAQISQEIRNLSALGKNVQQFEVLNKQLPIDLITELKAHANTPIRSGQPLEQDPTKFAKEFIVRIKQKFAKAIEGLKSEKGREGKQAQLQQVMDVLDANVQNIAGIYKAYLLADHIKMMFQRKMRQIRAIDSFIEQPDGSFKVTDPEGFVVVGSDGGAMKIVDRLEFSAANFA
jgi:hypothetical protein